MAIKKVPLQTQLNEDDRNYFNEMNERKNVSSSEVLREFVKKEIKRDKKELLK